MAQGGGSPGTTQSSPPTGGGFQQSTSPSQSMLPQLQSPFSGGYGGQQGFNGFPQAIQDLGQYFQGTGGYGQQPTQGGFNPALLQEGNNAPPQTAQAPQGGSAQVMNQNTATQQPAPSNLPPWAHWGHNGFDGGMNNPTQMANPGGNPQFGGPRGGPGWQHPQGGPQGLASLPQSQSLGS